MSTGGRHVVVVGLDDEHRRQLEGLPRDVEYHALYRSDELKHRERFPMKMLLEEGPRRLREARHPVDALVGYWDFPVSTTLPILRGAVGLPGPTLASVLACEHKYWSRIRQREALPQLVPPFCAVDPFAGDPAGEVTIDVPLWLNPIKSLRSHLAFLVRDEADLRHAVHRIRERIRRYGDPFDMVPARAELPPDVAHVHGSQCIAAAMVTADRQCTVEGYDLDGDTRVYGIVDSHREGPTGSSLVRYQYPSTVPGSVAERMRSYAIALVRHVGYRNGPFNIEFFWDEGTDRLRILEVNPRLSKSHSPLFRMVDGRSKFQVMVAVPSAKSRTCPSGQASMGWRPSSCSGCTAGAW